MAGSATAADPATVFARKCTSCHTVGKGDRVGPDLKGVTSRRSRSWLASWIRSPDRVIGSGDRVAAELLKKYTPERMPDQALAADDIEALIAYLAAGGPASGDSKVRHADAATAADVERGRALFLGSRVAASGGTACASCHSVAGIGIGVGGSFAGDLSHVYSRFQDPALAAFLRHPCVPRGADSHAAPLNDDEAFAVRAFLRSVDAASGGSR